MTGQKKHKLTQILNLGSWAGEKKKKMALDLVSMDMMRW